MSSLFEIYETIFQTALGESFVTKYPDLLGLVALVGTCATVYGFAYLIFRAVKRLVGGRKA